MNKNLCILIPLVILFAACKKDLNGPFYGFERISPTILRVSDSVVSSAGSNLVVNIQAVYLDTSFVEIESTQGTVLEVVEVTYPTTTSYTMSHSTPVLIPATQVENSSTLLLFDKSADNQIDAEFDYCLSYWLERVSGNHEYALGGFSSDYVNGFKVYDPGFINENSTDVPRAVFDFYSEPLQGTANPLVATRSAIDYMVAESNHENKSIVLITDVEVSEHDSIVNTLISKANNNNVSIHVIGLGSNKYSKITALTGGFYAETTYISSYDYRLIMYSIPKLIERKYNVLSFDLTIDKLAGSFGSLFGWYVYMLDRKIYYWNYL